jgi:hypothetical protein
VEERIDKGSALLEVKRRFGRSDEAVTAIGDSQHDAPMLKIAEYAYAPANCAPVIRQMAAQGECSVMRQTYQNGLLAAVRRRLGIRGAVLGEMKLYRAPSDLKGFLQTLLHVADRPRAMQLISVLSRRSF